jgi:hypothetical protein
MEAPVTAGQGVGLAQQDLPPACGCNRLDKQSFAKVRAIESGRQIFRAEAVKDTDEALGSTWDTFAPGATEQELAMLLQERLQVG